MTKSLTISQQEKPKSASSKQPKTKYDVIRSIADKSIVLSHTSFKEFADCPRSFMKYKTGRKKVTQAMSEGALQHAMLLEPDTVEDQYFIEPNISLQSFKGKEEMISFLVDVAQKVGVSEEVISEGLMINVESPEFKDKRQGYSFKLDYFQSLCGSRVVSQKAWDFAKEMVVEMGKNDSAGWLMNQTHTNETHVKWNAFGFKWQGFIDSMGDDVIFDLKKVQDAHPRKLRYTIRDMKIDWQAAHYTMGAGNDKDYYILAFDGNLNITVMNIHKEIIAQAWEDIQRHMTQFKKCAFLNQWNASYDFYARNGIYEY